MQLWLQQCRLLDIKAHGKTCCGNLWWQGWLGLEEHEEQVETISTASRSEADLVASIWDAGADGVLKCLGRGKCLRCIFIRSETVTCDAFLSEGHCLREVAEPLAIMI